jgi:hypothetical protein
MITPHREQLDEATAASAAPDADRAGSLDLLAGLGAVPPRCWRARREPSRARHHAAWPRCA